MSSANRFVNDLSRRRLVEWKHRFKVVDCPLSSVGVRREQFKREGSIVEVDVKDAN